MCGREIINNSQLIFTNGNSFSSSLLSFHNEKNCMDMMVEVAVVYFILLITSDMFLFK